jgi:hypothetical protein
MASDNRDDRGTLRSPRRSPCVSALEGACQALLFIVLATGPACKPSSEGANESKQMPRLPPPPSDGTPAANFSVTVEIDGMPAAALDRARLDATAPDFSDGDRRAWKVETLLGSAASREGATFTITGDKDVAVVLHRPRGATDAIPVLAVNRRGQLMAAMVELDDPFPPYHGQGRRLERRGDPLPRIEGIKSIVVSIQRPDAGS